MPSAGGCCGKPYRLPTAISFYILRFLGISFPCLFRMASPLLSGFLQPQLVQITLGNRRNCATLYYKLTPMRQSTGWQPYRSRRAREANHQLNLVPIPDISFVFNNFGAQTNLFCPEFSKHLHRIMNPTSVTNSEKLGGGFQEVGCCVVMTSGQAGPVQCLSCRPALTSDLLPLLRHLANSGIFSKARHQGPRFADKWKLQERAKGFIYLKDHQTRLQHPGL